jgi:hypothetical protein
LNTIIDLTVDDYVSELQELAVADTVSGGEAGPIGRTGRPITPERSMERWIVQGADDSDRAAKRPRRA